MASGGWRRQDICGNLMLGYQRRKAGASLIIEERGQSTFFSANHNLRLDKLKLSYNLSCFRDFGIIWSSGNGSVVGLF